jgi:hypothetical protein
MPTLNSHTHCQVAQPNPQAKTWQRVCLFQPATDRQLGRKENTERTTAVWRNGGCSASYNSFVVAESSVLRINICAEKPTFAKLQNVCDLNLRFPPM